MPTCTRDGMDALRASRIWIDWKRSERSSSPGSERQARKVCSAWKRGAQVTQTVIDQTEAREQAEKMFLGSFTLDDFLRLLQKIKKMGSIKDLLGMIPGLGAQMQNMPVDEKEFSRSEAIIQSMTPHERMFPEILGDSRRKRVAKGSGVALEAVHELMRSFREMKKQFQDLRKMGVLGGLLDPTRRLKKEKEQELLRMKKLGVNLFDPEQVRAYKQYSQRQAKAEARRAKRRK